MQAQTQDFPVHPAARFWPIKPGRIEPAAGVKGFSILNLKVWAANPKQLEHRLTILAEIGDSVIEVVTASEPLYFGHVNYSDEFNLVYPLGLAPLDGIFVQTYLMDPDTGASLGHYESSVGDIVVHPVGICHWPGYMPNTEKFRPPRAEMRMRILSMVYCAKGPVKYNDSAQPNKLGKLDWAPVEMHPDFANLKLRVPGGKFTDERALARAGVIALPLLMADRNRREDDPVAVARVGETRWDLIVSAGGPKKAFVSDEKSYVITYHGSPRLELLGPGDATVGKAQMESADMVEIPAGHGFRITGTESGKRGALLWFRKDPGQ